jgi:hypothetical protein
VKRFFTRNLRAKLFSLATAVLLWLSVAGEPELSTFVSAPVEYKNLSTELEINSDVVESVLLEVHGPSAELRGAPGGRPRYTVVLDMADAAAGQRTFTVEPYNVRLPRGVQLVHSIPAQIRLNFEPGATRSVPVRVRFADDPPPDMQVEFSVAEPPALWIAGPASRVARVESVETDPIHLKPQAGLAAYRMSAYVNDPHVRFVGVPQVTVKVKLGKK